MVACFGCSTALKERSNKVVKNLLATLVISMFLVPTVNASETPVCEDINLEQFELITLEELNDINEVWIICRKAGFLEAPEFRFPAITCSEHGITMYAIHYEILEYITWELDRCNNRFHNLHSSEHPPCKHGDRPYNRDCGYFISY